ncbi:hypothetical protein PLICRDRAFT_684635 [Plicaturopsis crispa FD-325 SS-3]|nr:hypothetical protein PLICRDRAFT_684635 [Plicaturopsis crispa FD-325 SS-3]
MWVSLLTPPQAAPSWNHSPEEILNLVKDTLQAQKRLQDKVATLAPAECNFQTAALAAGEADLDSTIEPLTFYQHVSPSQELSDSAREAERLRKAYEVDSSMRLDVFQAKVSAEKNIKASGQWDELPAEEKRLVDKMLLDGTRAGFALSDEERAVLTDLRKELSQACTEFRKNANEENGLITFTLEELQGVSADALARFTKHMEDGKELYDVPNRQATSIHAEARNPQTRERAQHAYENRLKINVPIINTVLDHRRKIAKILGYPTWADYTTEVKMAKNAARVIDFIDDLEERLKPIAAKECEVLLSLKKAEHAQTGLPFDGELYLSEYSYYNKKQVDRTLDFDGRLFREYFQVPVVIPEIIAIYQDLLGVRFREMKGETWHPDVQQYAVWDNRAPDTEPEFLGYLYLDIFSRLNKYSNVSVWPLIPGYDLPSGGRRYPVAALLASFTKPTPEKPALMSHHDVTMFFHELGHAFHELLSRTRFSRFHGTKGAIDFVEAPSQMLENWCWEPKILVRISSHYETQQPLSAELIEKLTKTRYAGVGLFQLRQLFYAKYDVLVHMDQEYTDYTKLWNELRESMTMLKGQPGPGQAGFGHLVGGYDVGYYGYAYSLVFAQDMYASVFKEDPFDPAQGLRYRDSVLCVGASKDELQILEDFLGRPPNSDAFLKAIFGTVQANC